MWLANAYRVAYFPILVNEYQAPAGMYSFLYRNLIAAAVIRVRENGILSLEPIIQLTLHVGACREPGKSFSACDVKLKSFTSYVRHGTASICTFIAFISSQAVLRRDPS